VFAGRWRFATLALPLAAVVLPFARANAEGAAVPVRVDSHGGLGCPTESFAGRLLARDTHIRLAQPNEPAPLVIVRIDRDGRSVHGHIVIRDVDGTQSERNVRGDTCESVSGALVLVAAIAIDPTLSIGTASDSTTDAGTPSGTNTEEAAAAPSSTTADHPDASWADASRATTTTERESSHAPPVDRRLGWHAATGGGAGIESGAAPAAVLTWSAFFEVTKNTDHVLAPIVRLLFEHSNSGDQDVTGGAVRFVRNLGVIDACPLQASVGPLRLLPCLELEAGVVNASGHDVTPTRSEARPWLALGAVGRVRYVPISPLFLEVSGGLRVPLLRDHFYFEPNNTVFEAPALSGFAGGTIGLWIL
jgi:hypothetical protein